MHNIAKIATKQPAPSGSEESLISLVIRKKHKLPITAKTAIPAHPHKNIIRTKVTSVDIQPPLRIQKAVINLDASDTVALRFRQQRSAFADSIFELFSGLTICAHSKLGFTEEFDRLKHVADFGNLTLGYFAAIGRQAAFKKLAGAEDFVAKLVTESNLRAAGMGNPKQWNL